MLHGLAILGIGAALPVSWAHADLKQAQSLQAAGKIEAAREAYEEVLTHGDNREAMYQLALLSQSGHDYVRYLQQFLEAGGRRDKRAAEVEVRLGRYHYTAGDYHAALDQLESARERRTDPETRVEVRFWLGQTLLALRERDDARRAFESVISDRAGGPWKSRALYSLGEILRVSGDPGAAARTFAQLRSDSDLGAAAMLAEAQCREKGGDRREAAALY
ncbi:MAG TPA: tetratricopeptide repeat protein, partial [Candidatus Eisenbacteria bacterium]